MLRGAGRPRRDRRTRVQWPGCAPSPEFSDRGDEGASRVAATASRSARGPDGGVLRDRLGPTRPSSTGRCWSPRRRRPGCARRVPPRRSSSRRSSSRRSSFRRSRRSSFRRSPLPAAVTAAAVTAAAETAAATTAAATTAAATTATATTAAATTATSTMPATTATTTVVPRRPQQSTATTTVQAGVATISATTPTPAVRSRRFRSGRSTPATAAPPNWCRLLLVAGGLMLVGAGAGATRRLRRDS